MADEGALLAIPDFHSYTIAPRPQSRRHIVSMHLDILYRRVVKFQRRAILSKRRHVEHSILSKDACYEHLQLLVSKIDTKTLSSSFGECEMAPE